MKVIIIMEKSGIQKLAQSTFTSQFFTSSVRADLEKCIAAMKNNRVSALHSIVSNEASKPSDPHEKPLLQYAAFYNSPACTLYLLQKGADLSEQDGEGKTVFHLCAYTGHVDVLKVIRNEMKLRKIRELSGKYVEMLMANNYKRTDMKGGQLKFSVSEARKKAFSKMQEAITELYRGYVLANIQEIAKYLITPVKNTNRNCFHLACLNRYQRCLNALEFMFEELSNCDLNIDQQAFQLYTEVGNCFDDHVRVDPRLFQDTLNLIREAILPQKLAEISRQAEKRIQDLIEEIMASKDLDGHTPLHTASKNGYTAIINLLRKWESQASKKLQDTEDLIKVANHNLARSHILDLCEASKLADSRKMNFLLSCGQEINKKKTIFGTFALLQAVKSFQTERSLEPIRLLILSGADINEQDTNGWTILHHACEKGMQEVLAEVFKIWEEGKVKRIAINKLTNKNYHILHLAAINNHPHIIEYLLTASAPKKLEIDSAAIDGDGCNMLHHAARKGAIQALKKILELQPNLIYTQDIRNNTSLHYAAMNDHSPCIRYLLYFDSDSDHLLQIKNSRGKLAKDLTVNKKPFESVFTAARTGDVNLVRRMISQNGEMKGIVTQEKQRNLLVVGVLNGHLLVVKFLISMGVDPLRKDKLGKSARDYAIEQEKNCKNKQELVGIRNILALLQG